MKWRIAQVAPLYESVPPKLYGGTERIVSYLTDALVDMGHEVTLFASGDSVTKAQLVPIHHGALRLGHCKDPLAMHVLQLQEVIEQAATFDIIHFHTDYHHFPVSRLMNLNTVTTLHGRLDIPELKHVYSRFPDIPVVSISQAQRDPLPMARWAGTVHHGLPLNLYRPGEGKGGYVLFIGRISPEKRPDRAIEIARRAGINIKIAAKVDDADKAYYEEQIRPLMQQPHVDFIGEVGEKEKNTLLGNASALLFPIDWPEPFGMVMIEALACGTPVIAYGHGSVPEVLEHGKTGYIVHSLDEAVDALQHIGRISRDTCRRVFETRFTSLRMAQDYAAIYEQLIRLHNQPYVSLPAQTTGHRVLPLQPAPEQAVV
jgi:glycosyltransferase involved in cell wall biosynthesis